MDPTHLAIATAHSILSAAPDFEKKRRRDEIEYIACLKNLTKYPLFPSITRDFAILMKMNRLDLGSWDHKEYCQILLQVPYYKYPDLTFDFASGSVKFKAVKNKVRKSMFAMFSYNGMRNYSKFQSNLVKLCRGLSSDCKVYSSVLERISQTSDLTPKIIVLNCPLNTGLAGQTVSWDPSEQPGEGGAQEIAFQLLEASNFYDALAKQIPEAISNFRAKGIEYLFFIAWENLAAGFFSGRDVTLNSSQGLRSVSRYVKFKDFNNLGNKSENASHNSIKLSAVMEASFKSFLRRLEAVHTSFQQREFGFYNLNYQVFIPGK